MKLLLPDHLAEALRAPIRQIAPQSQIVTISPSSAVDDSLEDVEVFFLHWGLDQEALQQLLRRMPNLRWLHTISAGVDHVPLPQLAASDVLLTNASGVFDTPVAEVVLAYMLSVVKRLPEMHQQQRARRWQPQKLDELRGLTAGILCMGSIGVEVARLSRAFGMHVLGLQRHPRPHEHAEEVLPPERRCDLLRRSDFVVVACPLTPETERLIGANELAAMKPTGWLINIARGPLVDEEALIKALQQRQIGGACLDVFTEEPLPEQSPLWDLPNVIITPHNAGSSPHTVAVSYTHLTLPTIYSV